jgi:general secretion pathway protein H
MPVRSRGFTLLEIMLVIMIIGCSVGIVVLSLPNISADGQDIKSISEKLAASIQVASEQSILEGRTIALYVDDKGYKFMVRSAKEKDDNEAAKSDEEDDTSSLDDSEQNKEPAETLPTPWEDQIWTLYTKERFVSTRDFPEKTEMKLDLGGLPLEQEENRLGATKQGWFDAPANAEDEDTQPLPEPQIFILPGNEITPFTLTLSLLEEGQTEPTKDNYRQIKVDETGKVRVLTADDVRAEASK